MSRTLLPLLAVLAFLPLARADTPAVKPDPLPGTKPLTLTGDLASQLVEGVDRFLLREIENAAKGREKFWKRDLSSPDAYTRSLEPNRQRLSHILGMRDERIPFKAPQLVATVDQPALVGKGANYNVLAVRWPALGEVHGEGLLLVPARGKPTADVVAIPDADVTPEQLVGLAPGVPAREQYARRLAESGCRVLVPTLIDRTYEARQGRAKMTSREFLYRSAFELGRHLIGYEVQKVLAGVDWFANEGGANAKLGVFGWGEGGMLALYAGALDTRISVVGVSGYFGNRDRIWEQPLDRNVFGLLEQFGDAELGAMVMPRWLVIEANRGPELTLPSEGGAPARLTTPDTKPAQTEFARIKNLVDSPRLGVCSFTHTATGGPGSPRALQEFLRGLGGTLAEDGKAPEDLRKSFDPRGRQQRQLKEIDRHNQQVLEESP
jgi:hypothetical protein